MRVGLNQVRSLRLTAEAKLNQLQLKYQNLETLQDKEPTEERKQQNACAGICCVPRNASVNRESLLWWSGL